MDLETGHKIIDFAFEVAPQEEKINFCFFGGEPLLRLDLIKDFTTYIEKKNLESDRSISFNLTTNSLLLDEKVLKYLSSNKYRVCLSIDGPEHIHNLNRIYPNGSGSFQDVLLKLNLVKQYLDYFQVNAVYNPQTISSLASTVSYFTDLDIPIIHLNLDISANWTQENIMELKSQYMKLADHYINCFNSGKEMALNLIDSKIILLTKNGYDEKEKCRMGELEFGFAPSGNIYPCERLIGEDDDKNMIIGNINTGIDNFALCKMNDSRKDINEECRQCDLSKYCMHWCGCTNYHMTGKISSVSPFLCQSEKASIYAASHVLNCLKDNDLFIDHLYNYISNDPYHQNII
jgi:uncharacterized protein